jgi:general secretion pathway protein G
MGIHAIDTALFGSNRRRESGFSLLELIIIMAIIAILAMAGISQYRSSLEFARLTRTKGDIKTISQAVDVFHLQNGEYPSSLDDVDFGKRTDPWGSQYQYLDITDANNMGNCRKDKNLVPINTDYDLYSMGLDRKTVPPLPAQDSQDDIIRANDGDYIGVAEKY